MSRRLVAQAGVWLLAAAASLQMLLSRLTP
jgi:hypothetical protein